MDDLQKSVYAGIPDLKEKLLAKRRGLDQHSGSARELADYLLPRALRTKPSAFIYSAS
jgi:hypothetical protein